MKKHIVHVVESFGAGVLSIIAEIANQQVKDGCQVSLIYSLREETPKDWQTLFDKAIQCHYVSMQRAINPILDVIGSLQLIRLFYQLRPNIVHLHSSKAGAIGRFAALFYPRAAYFFSPHGLSFLHGSNVVSRALYLFLEKLLNLLPGQFIACSASEAQLIKKHITSDVEIVENAVSAKPILVKSEINQKLRIGMVGRISPQKSPETFAAIARACQNLPVEFIWVGAGDPKSEQLLRQSRVSVTGWLERKKVLEMLASLDIYLQTSLWEGMPVAVIEAMLAGLPTIVRSVGGNTDVVLPGKTGFFANNEEDFIKLIHLFLQNQGRILTMGQMGREHALRYFSIENMTQKLYQVYGVPA